MDRGGITEGEAPIVFGRPEDDGLVLTVTGAMVSALISLPVLLLSAATGKWEWLVSLPAGLAPVSICLLVRESWKRTSLYLFADCVERHTIFGMKRYPYEELSAELCLRPYTPPRLRGFDRRPALALRRNGTLVAAVRTKETGGVKNWERTLALFKTLDIPKRYF